MNSLQITTQGYNKETFDQYMDRIHEEGKVLIPARGQSKSMPVEYWIYQFERAERNQSNEQQNK